MAAGADETVAAVVAASRLVMGLSAGALAEVDDSLSLAQLRTLVALEGCGPVKLAALAGVLGVNPSTALRAVVRLEEAGLVNRRVSLVSRREVVLTLTSGGLALVRRVLDRRRAAIEQLVAGMPAAARSGLVAGLLALLAVAEDRSVPVPGAGTEFRDAVG
ncbi:MarR family transcriptional regulator [Kitasatospora sp. NPDC096077]|uniref:MarR family winged helix-turn-helix transcriptional regulator n=1 Tax=Kitasatospora sp. NPDC096077 TaxID=3155544 RepID=UPI00332F7F55